MNQLRIIVMTFDLLYLFLIIIILLLNIEIPD